MAKDKSTPKDSSKVWTAFSLGSAILGATVARKVLTTGWQKATGKNPPANPADPDVEIWEAVMWATASGIAVQLARMFASRRAAEYYAKSTGHLPPGLGRDDQDPQESDPATT